MSVAVDGLSAALADRYRIERELGAGGMATVYLAHDLKHDRKVAVKVLRPELAAVIGAERFLSEIKTTANLQHPHILPLHDSGAVNGTVFYVMPYVEGESLRDRLVREKQLPIADTVRIASEVASALDYAHRHGVIHRDIKPENILLHDGRALVADFGIALAASSSGTRMTETGMSLGTPHYMSPEQAMGEREITARSDVYALGAMTYEMLVGEPPFTGPTAQAIIAKVVTAEPVPPSDIRKTVPAHVDDAVLTALQKLPADRFASAAGFAEAMAGHGTTTMVRSRPGAPGARTPRSALARGASWAGWAVAVVAIAAALWGWLRSAPRPESRFAVAFPGTQALSLTMLGSHVAVSRDGSLLVYTGGDSAGGRLWLKRRGELAATSMPGTEGAYGPFISPDGREIGFLTDRGGRSMRVVAAAGGPARIVPGATVGTSGASWGTDGYIYFDADQRGLQRTHPDGTGLSTVMRLDAAAKEVGIGWPQVLPGDKFAIMRMRHGSDAPGDFSIVAVRIATGERRTVTRGVSAVYSSGQLFFVTADGTLQAAPFDRGRLALSGPPVVVAGSVQVAGTYAGVDLAVTEDGTLYYVAGAPGVANQLSWIGRDGTAQPVDAGWRETGEIRSLSLAPNGGRVAVELSRAGTTGTDIWVKQLPGGPLSRLTLDPAADYRPAWSADGKWVYFVSERLPPASVFRHAADGSGTDVPVARADRDISELSISPDGRWLLARTLITQRGAGDILALRLGQDSAFQPILETPAYEAGPVLSPDGHWLAYVSSASGRQEVYVRSFPDGSRGVWQVSTDGGNEPRWSHSGRELFFRGIATLDLMVVDVQTAPVFRPGAPRTLFHTSAASGAGYARYDVSLDDRRILALLPASTDAQPQLIRIESFISNLSRRAEP
ncbi:MAG: protein kinase domain-containing protein [Bacillota bacterium]